LFYLYRFAWFFALLKVLPKRQNSCFCVCQFAGGYYLRLGGPQNPPKVAGMSGAYGNVGYMGPPLALAAFGPAAIAGHASAFCLFEDFRGV
jgi:predicted permease